MAKRGANRTSIIIYCIIFGWILALCFISLYQGITTIENNTERYIHILTYVLLLIVCIGLFSSTFILIVFAGSMEIKLRNIGSEFIKQGGRYPTSSNDLFTGFFLLLMAETFSMIYSETEAQVFIYFSRAFSIIFIISIVISVISIYFQLNQTVPTSKKFNYTKHSMRPIVIGLLLLLVTNRYVVGFIYNNLIISRNTALLILIYIIILCYFLAMSFCQFSNIYCALGIIYDKKNTQKNQKNLDNLKQWNAIRKIALLHEINEMDSKSEKRGFFKRCWGLLRLGINSLKSYFQGRGYIVAFLFLLAIRRINKLFSNLLEEDRIRTNMIRFCAITVVAEFLLLDILLFTFLGGENSCSRFFELLSTVVIIPILLSALLNLRTSKQKGS